MTAAGDLSVALRLPTEAVGAEAVERAERWRLSPTPGVRFIGRKVRDLPMICPRHGTAAIDHIQLEIPFMQWDEQRIPHSPAQTWRFYRRTWWRVYRGLPKLDTSARLWANWPACHLCVSRRRTALRTGVGLLLLPLFVAVAFVLESVGTPHPVVLAAFLLGIPGGFPIGMVVGTSLLQKSNTYIPVDPIDERPFVTIRAHPNFAEAVRAHTGAETD